MYRPSLSSCLCPESPSECVRAATDWWRISGALIGTANELPWVEMPMRRVADSEGALAGGETDGDSMHRERAQSFPRFRRDDVGCARRYSRARRCDGVGLERIW